MKPGPPVPGPPQDADLTAASFGVVQFCAVLLLVALADLTTYRGHGYAGYAALFAAAPLLMAIAAFRPRRRWHVFVIAFLTALLAARLVWWGSPLTLGLGFVLLAAFAMALSGLPPYVLEGIAFVAQTFGAGYVAIYRQWQRANRYSPTVSGRGVMAVALPAVAFVAFGMLFVLANPDLAAALGDEFERFAATVRTWLADFAPNVTEVLFCLAAFWIVCGALRPLTANSLLKEQPPAVEAAASPVFSEPAPLYPAFRNTLVTVIALFAVYLVFEFQTLWFREFPKGFYYSGYAHEGAFWLTVALALTTLTLSLVFRGRILDDPRQRRLRRLAWVWSLENLLLAAAVYHRLLIYVGFNGMTRMRVVGFCGISAVVVGFLLVLWKILAGRDFVWLVRRQLWALFLFVYLYAVLPVDALVMRYNVQRILNGDPAPSVQISVHPIDPDGLLQLVPLLKSDNEVIREGVRALLSEQYEQALDRVRQLDEDGWTAFQLADRRLLDRLEPLQSRLRFPNRTEREGAWNRFRDYAYQWY